MCTGPRHRPTPAIDIAEGDDWTTWNLTEAQFRTLSTRTVGKILSLKPTPGHRDGTTWDLKAKRTVGAVGLGAGDGALLLRIAPKTTVDRLLHVLAHAQEKRLRWQPAPVDAAVHRDLFPAIAHTFTRAAERALHAGALSGYRDREDTSMTLRGRLRAADQLRRRPGLALPLEIAYDEHTTDIAENQLLLGAARRLSRVPGIPEHLRTRLRQLDVLLEGVTAPRPGARIPAWSPNRLNARYVPVLRLADIILRGASFEYDDGRPVTVDGLLLNMEKVFEDFVANAFGAALERLLGGRAQAQATHYLDERKKHRMHPDLLHRLPMNGELLPTIVVDAKYQDGIESANLYQMLAYCTRFGLAEGHLVSSGGEEDGTAIRIPVHGGAVTIHRHVLDLSLSPSQLNIRVDELAQTIAAARTDQTRTRA
ncbi:restriction endonuclease [Streptomyces sp. SID14478]|nr:restriction endonuclease [Streptomyces sp. SID14478]